MIKNIKTFSQKNFIFKNCLNSCLKQNQNKALKLKASEMELRLRRREKYIVSNTLNCLPMILCGQAVLIDLQNEISVAGRIDNADAYMNIHLSDAVLIDRNGQQYPFDEFMVRDRLIRQIHFPPGLNVNDELRNWMENCLGKRPNNLKTKKKRTFKQVRAERRHKEILNEIIEKNQEQ